jgi:hypothetical protein
MRYANKSILITRSLLYAANKQEVPILLRIFTFLAGTLIVNCKDDIDKGN